MSDSRFLTPVRAALEKLHPPAGPFSPDSEWEHLYSVLVLTPARMEKGEHAHPYGKLRLTRKAAAGGQFQLAVDLAIQTRGRSGMHTRASLVCAADRLASPQRWELHSDIVEDGGPAPLPVSETAAVRDGEIVRPGRARRKVGARALTSNWSLMEAVQRLPFDTTTPLEFDMLEDMDMHKAGQSLHAIGTVTVRTAAGDLQLNGFRHTGRGILPIHYWLDREHRLILAEGSLRAFLWEQKA
jgi:hypothetical protein